ncbi:hypothetical protein PHMEG_00024112 [Phytophthora megakarya]|uniref:DDE Tnp4 domain-containing protein n=1 Tax=Phytophthora megakarya TaxID=4795 RepID=A0A225VEH6_9STRA|nr:hypothetical protein PHMEG_00024112 [Phytophthora megakarya]
MEIQPPAIVVLTLLLVVVVVLPIDRRHKCFRRSRINWEEHAQLLVKEKQYQKCYKMSYTSFMALAAKLELYLSVNEKQSRGSYHDIRSKRGVSVGAFYAAIHDVIDAIVVHLGLQLHFPTTVPAQRNAAKEFQRLRSSHVIKGCVGAVDGWLCPIRVPCKDEVARVRSFFSGHYQRYGVNVQACCDHLGRFTAVTCLSAGGTGDAVAYLKWKFSSVVDKLPNGLPKISTPAHDSYNYHLSQLRIRIEIAFGLLRVFKSPLEIAFNRVPRPILAACILHNWCINRRLLEGRNYRVDEDEDLLDGLEEARVENPLSPNDGTVEPIYASRYRRLYESSDLDTDTANYNNSEWAREALVTLLESNSIMQPMHNRARRERETHADE